MSLLPKSGSKRIDAFFHLALLNLALFMVIALLMGGDAVNGKTKDGRYYLANHGKLTEVSKATFIYSKLHVYSVFATFPLALVLFWCTSSRNRGEHKA